MRKKSTRLLSAALAACMMAAVLPLGAMAQGRRDEETENSVSVPDVSSAPTTDEEKEKQGWVKIDKKHFPDENFREIVQNKDAGLDDAFTFPNQYPKVKFDQDHDGWLSPKEIADVKAISCSRYTNQIEKLTGIEYFKALEYLDCDNNQLTELDVSSNKALKNLTCGKNQLTELDVSSNTALEDLYCVGNQLTELDVSSNTVLKNLYCSNNQLKKLDVRSNTALKILSCYKNQLTQLDVSSNTALEDLECGENQLTELNVSSNTNLWSLGCVGNQLTELNVSSNTALQNLYCYNNQLTKLDVSSNTKLMILTCGSNQLTSLDLENTNIKNSFIPPDCLGNRYNIKVNPENRFDLGELPDGFDVNKASDWKNGRVDVIEGRNILTVAEGVDKVTYTYNCGTSRNGKKITAEFALITHTHSYGGWSYDETDHWKECTAPDCPEREESVKGKAAHAFDEDGICTVCGYQQGTAVPDAPAGGSAADNIKGALSAVVVGAVAGAIIYETGTGIYRVINMPGIPMPSDRIELAELLWEHAGKPEPVSTALYSDITEDDIDLNKAARWAVEQDLMQDNSEKNTFNPHFPVSKLRTCLTWNAAKEKGLLDTDKPAE